MSRYISPFEEDNDGLKLGSDGTFSFRGFVGNSYLIKISATNIKGKKFSKQIEIKIDENLKFLEVILDTPEKD